MVYNFVLMGKKSFEEVKTEYFPPAFFVFCGFTLCSGANIGDHLGKAGRGYCFFSPLMLLQSFGGTQGGQRSY